MCRYDYLCFLIYSHLSIIAYSSILFVYYIFFSNIEHHVSIPTCLQNKTQYCIVVCSCANLPLSLSLSPSIHVRLYLTLSIHFHLHGFIYGYCISLLVVHICVSISMPPEMHLFAFCLSRSLYVCLSVGEPPDAMTGVA